MVYMTIKYEIKKETPANIDDLVKMAGEKTNWGKRLEAVNELKKWDCQKSRDVLTRLALHDRVYTIMEEAFRAAQALGITKNGKPIYLGKKDIGYKSSDFKKVFSRIKRECKLEELDLQIFNDKFIQDQPEMYDVMLHEKGNTIDTWIENIYNSLPKK
jgi:hypothetical protein